MALNEAEVAQVRRAGEHFKKILRSTFELFPRSARSIAGLARWTRINKSTCQRFVQALTKSNDGIDVILTLPGASGLKQLEKSFNSLLESSSDLLEFNKMVDEYEDLILQFAASQSELKRQLLKYQNKSTQSFSAYNRKLKKDAYQINRDIAGESVDAYLGIHYFRINPDDPTFLDEFIIANKQGVELSKSARPFVQNFGGNLNEIEIKDPVTIEAGNQKAFDQNTSGEYLLADYSTPQISQCYAGVGNLRNTLIYNHTVEPINSAPFNITLAHLDTKTQPNPLSDSHKIICQSLMQRSPAKRLILVALMDKTLDKGCDIQAGCYPMSVKIHEKGHQPEDFWSERFSDSPEIKLFSPDDKSLSLKLKMEKVDSLIESGFKLLNENAEDYVGYFIDIEYPLWLTSHRFYFTFRD